MFCVMTCHAFCSAIMQVSAKELTALLTKPSLQGIPLLVLGNKNDLPGALGTQQLIERMGLQVRVLWTSGVASRSLFRIEMHIWYKTLMV
jgi:hypothetical protein